MTRPVSAFFAVVLAAASAAVSCSGGGNTAAGPSSPSPPSWQTVRAWTGTLKILARQSGSGTSNFAGFTILENLTHDSEANLTLTLARDPSLSSVWVGSAQGSVTINNKNVMTMTAPEGIVTCTGTLLWIGNNPQFAGQVRLDGSSGSSIRLSLQPTTIPAPNAGNVVCPTTGAQFPTTDPDSPFGPTDLLAGLSMVPASSGNQNLFAFTTALGYSGIGGFFAATFRISYTVDLNLTAVP